MLLKFFSSYFCYLLFVMMTVIPLLSIALWIFLSRKIRVKVAFSQEDVEKEEIQRAFLILNHPKFAFATNCNICLRIENTFYGEVEDKWITLPLLPGREQSIEFPLKAARCGQVKITVRETRLFDLMGWVSYNKVENQPNQYVVMPKYKELSTFAIADYKNGLQECEEARGKGSDFSEISDIREYQQGDRIKDIHWKLSARKDTLLVKERVNLSGEELVVLLELGGVTKQVEEVIEDTYQFCVGVIKQRIPLCILWYQDNHQGFMEYQVGNDLELKNTFCKLFQMGRGNDEGRGDSIRWMQILRPLITNYVYLYREEGKARVRVMENV